MRRLLLLALVARSLAPAARAQAGAYTVAGTNPAGDGRYGGTMTVSRTGDTLRVVWETGGAPVEGIGLRRGRVLAVAYSPSSECSVVAYHAEGGRYVATWAMRGGTVLGTEDATPTDREGFYRVSGTTPGGGGRCQGTLELRLGPHATALHWEVGGEMYDGLGLALDGVLGAAFGDPTCGIAVYALSTDGTLDGVWTGPGLGGVGTERATPSAATPGEKP